MEKWKVEKLRLESLTKDRDNTEDQIRHEREKTAFSCKGHHIFISPKGNLFFTYGNGHPLTRENALALADWIKDMYSEAAE